MIYDHVSGSLSKLDAKMVRAVPEGGKLAKSSLRASTPLVFARYDRVLPGAKEAAARITAGLRWDRPCYTVSTYFNRPGNGCFIHPLADRLITIREAARLQEFPRHIPLLRQRTRSLPPSRKRRAPFACVPSRWSAHSWNSCRLVFWSGRNGAWPRMGWLRPPCRC